jgi:RNA-binding protein YlmH
VDEQVYQHFRADETQIIDEINDAVSQAIDQYRPVLTGFLNPRQLYIAQSLINRHDDEVSYQSFGGYDDAEMQRVLLYPAYYQPTKADFQLQVLQVKYPQKFAELKHRQILGTLISQGIERSSFGDIITDGREWQVIVDEKMAQYFELNVDKVANIKVALVEVSPEAVLMPVSDWEVRETTATSLRIDIIVSTAFNYSRNRAKTLIESGNVRLNWVTEVKPDYPIKVHDMISVRHAGRIKLIEIDGTTKKNKIRVTLATVTAS